MTLTRNQKIGATIGVLILLIGGILVFKKKEDEPVNLGEVDDEIKDVITPSTEVSTTSIVNPTRSYMSQAEGSFNADGDPALAAKEMYATIVGTAAYILTSKDTNAVKVRALIQEDSIKNGRTTDESLMKYVIKLNKGKAGLKDAVKMLDQNIMLHANYLIKNDTLMK
jgi:hypothetical protein